MDISLTPVACSRGSSYDSEVQLRVTNGMDKQFNWVVVTNTQVVVGKGFSTRADAEANAKRMIDAIVEGVVKNVNCFPKAKE